MTKNLLDKEKGNKNSKKDTPGSATDQPSETRIPGVYDNKLQVVNLKNWLQDHYEFKLDILAHDVLYRKVGETDYQVVNDNDLALELMENEIIKSDRILKIMLGSSLVKEDNPAINYFESLPPHQETDIDHISTLAKYIETDDNRWFSQQFKKFLVRAVRGVYTTKFNKQMMVLQGNSDDGKSYFLRWLCPDKLEKYRKDNLDFSNEKDSRISICRNFWINLEELGGLERHNMNKVKALMSADFIKERLPYASKETKIKRVCTFTGSTNRSDFLTDSTGSVRFLVFRVEKIKHDKGGPRGYESIDKDKIWSQAVSLFKNGFECDMTPSEVATSQLKNRAYQETLLEGEILDMYLKPGIPNKVDNYFKTSKEILQILNYQDHCLKINYQNLNESLIFYGFKKVSYREKGKLPKYGYWIIYKKNTKVPTNNLLQTNIV